MMIISEIILEPLLHNEEKCSAGNLENQSSLMAKTKQQFPEYAMEE